MKKLLIGSAIFCIVAIYFAYIDTTKTNTLSLVDRENKLLVTWPEHSAVLKGTHTFKASLSRKPLNSYDIYWAIDDGSFNRLEDSFVEFPHKQGVAEITQGTESNNSHIITFVATEKNNPENILDTKHVTIYTDSTHNSNSVIQKLASAIGANNIQSEDSKNALTHITDSDVTLDWVTEGTEDTFDQLFTLSVHNINPSQYYAFWQVGNGAYNKMKPQDDTQTVASHINFNSWTWKNNGPYEVFFIIQNRNAEEIFRKKISINRYNINESEFVATNETNVVAIQTNETDVDDPKVSVPDSHTEIITKDISLHEKILYVAPNKAGDAIAQTDNQVIQTLLEFIAYEPQAIWLTGNTDDTQQVSDAVKNSASDELPTFVLYNIPHRDCGSYSSGGASDAPSYSQWVDTIIDTLNESPAIFIIEPDALASASCLSDTHNIQRIELIAQTVKKIKERTPSKVYIDIGHPYWLSVTDASSLLTQAGIIHADGFALNTSNYIATEENITYGNNILNRLGQGDLAFVIDTSRNGNGPDQANEWCNPSGRALGKSPQLLPETNVDAFLWIKRPGESDGTCNGGKAAGTWWIENALSLITQMINGQIQHL